MNQMNVKGMNRKAIAGLMIMVMLLTLMLPLGTQITEAAGGEKPVVLHATWKVEAGDAVGIYGGNLGGTDVEVKAQPLSSTQPLDPSNATVDLEVIKAEDQLVQVIMPNTAPADAYAVWVITAEGASDPFWFNRAEPFWISDTTAYAGQAVRLFGRNLNNPSDGTSTAVSVELVSTLDATRHTAVVQAANAYTADFVVPAAAVGGEYRIEVTNGSGGSAGKVLLENDQTLTVIAQNANALSLEASLGLSVHWLTEIPHDQQYDAQTFGATGDGLTDDTEAIQAALDEAEGDGGGIVYLPEGTYSFSSLSIPSRTILTGAGKELTKLIFNGEAVPNYPRSILPRESFTVRTYGEAEKLIFSDGNYSGVANLGIKSDVIRPATDTRRRIHGYVVPIAFLGIARGGHDAYGSSPIPVNSGGYLVKNVHAEIADGSGIAVYSTGITVIEDSEFEVTHGGLESSNKMVRYRNNEVSNMMRPGTHIGEGRAWYENNTLTGIDYETYVPTVGFRFNEAGGAIEHRYGDFPQAESYVAGNHTKGVFGTATGNEGEGMLWQGQGRLKYGKATAGAVQSLTDTAAAFTAAFVGKQVTITGGKGLGQQRKVVSFTATQLVLDQPWDIIPDATSAYTVDVQAAFHNIVIDNLLEGQTNKGGIMFYTKDYDNIIEGNTLTHSGGIWLAANQDNNGLRADYSYFTLVKNNIMSGSSKPGHGQGNTLAIGPGVDGGIVAKPDPVLPSVGVFGNEIRGNDLTSIGSNVPYTGTFQENYVARSGIVVSTPGLISYPMSQGMIVQGNRVRDAYAGVHLANSSYNTLLANNDFAGNGNVFNDSGSVGTMLWNGTQKIPYLVLGKANQKIDGTTKISWPAVTLAASYTVSRSVYKEGPFTELATVTSLEYVDSTAASTPYYYKLVPKDATNAEGATNVIQSKLRLVEKGAFDTSGRSFQLAVADGIAYVADRDSIQVLDVSDPAHIQQLSSLVLGTATLDLFLDGDTLYATDNGVFYAIDVSDPELPAVIATKAMSTAGDITVVDGIAYVARGSNGLGIYDVFTPGTITQLKVVSGLGSVAGVYVVGDYAYVAAANAGVKIINIATPSAAAVVGTYSSVILARNIVVEGNYAYVADALNTGTGGLLVLDVSVPSAPSLVSRLDSDSATQDVALIGSYALLGGYRNQLVMASIANPAAPAQVGEVTTPNNSVFDTVVDNGLIYIANSNNGIKIYAEE